MVVIGLGLRAPLPVVPRPGRIRPADCEHCTSRHWQRPGDNALGPRVELFSGFGSAITTQQDFEKLLVFALRQPDAAPASGGRYVSALRSVERLRASTETLQEEVSRMEQLNIFEVYSAQADFSGVRATVRGPVQADSFQLRVLQPARAQVVASDAVEDPVGSLGLEGALLLEGRRIEISSGQSLAGIAAAINSAFESESAGVSAAIDSEGRLTLTRLEAGRQPIQLEQEGGVAISLGLLQESEEGRLIFANELSSGQEAWVEYEGQIQEFASNNLTDLIPGLEITLNPERFSVEENVFGARVETPVDVRIEVEQDISSVRNAISRFVEQFNQTVTAYNEEIFYPGGLDGDRLVSAARFQLLRAVGEPISGEGETSTIGDIGIEQINRPMNSVSELTVRRLARPGRQGQPGSPLAEVRGTYSIIEGLGRLGIRQKDDGTLRIDQERLETALQENPQLVQGVLNGSGQSVFVRLEPVLEAFLDESGGVFARRERLFQRLEQLGQQQPSTLEALEQGYRQSQYLQEVLREQGVQLEKVLADL
jgi:flagellar capping protein FliD